MTFMPTNNPLIKNGGLPNVLGAIMKPAQKMQRQAGPSNVLAGVTQQPQPQAMQQKPTSALAKFDQRMTNALSPDTALGGMVHGFARGLDPNAYEQQQSEQMQVALATGQHLLQMPEQQRLAMVQQDWDRWSVLVGAQGMPFDQWLAQDPTALTDQSLQSDLVALQAQMGQGPDMEAIQRQQQAEQIRATMGDKAYYAYLSNPEEFGKNLAQWQGMNNQAVNNQIVDMTTGDVLNDVRSPIDKAPQNELFSPDGSNLIQGPNAGYVDRENFSNQTNRMNAQANQTRANQPRNGIRVSPDGTIQIGGSGGPFGTAPKGKEAAVIEGRGGEARTTPGPQQEKYSKAFRTVQETSAQNSIVLEDIDRALEMSGGWTTGIGGAVFRGLPGTPAFDLNQTVDTIRANVGFDKLQNMREISPTGGALGAVTERELAFLQNVFGSLETAQSQQQFEYNLGRLKEHLAGREQRLQEALAADFPELASTMQFRRGALNDLSNLQQMSDEELDALIAEAEGNQ